MLYGWVGFILLTVTGNAPVLSCVGRFPPEFFSFSVFFLVSVSWRFFWWEMITVRYITFFHFDAVRKRSHLNLNSSTDDPWNISCQAHLAFPTKG